MKSYSPTNPVTGHVPQPGRYVAADTTSARLLALARSFPSLDRKLPADFEWDPLGFVAILRGASHGERCAAQFVLSVWNPTARFSVGKFDLQDAIGTWDREHRAAFAAWCREPWWA